MCTSVSSLFHLINLYLFSFDLTPSHEDYKQSLHDVCDPVWQEKCSILKRMIAMQYLPYDYDYDYDYDY
jgi:hypothetical protein